MIIQCLICEKIKHYGKWETMPKEIGNMQHVQILHSLCPDCGEDLEMKLLDRFKAINTRINRLQFCERGVAIMFLIMCLVTSFCAFSHFLIK